MQSILETYAELKLKEKAIATQIEALKPQALAELHALGTEKHQMQYGTFSLKRTEKYTYTEKVKELEEQVKISKVDEERSGAAKMTVVEVMSFLPKKAE